jgi:hypothetical protein
MAKPRIGQRQKLILVPVTRIGSNPRPVFAKQTNIANGPQQVNSTTGPQQVNNGVGHPEPETPRGKNENPIPTNKLLEQA